MSNNKTIDDFTKEELFEFYNKVRSTERYTFDGSLYNNPNIDLLDEINYMVREMEKHIEVESSDIVEPETTMINMITAICLMEDQDCCVEEVRYIEHNQESINSFEEEMSEKLGMYGYRLCYFTAIIPLHFTEVLHDVETYRWMAENEKYEIDV